MSIHILTIPPNSGIEFDTGVNSQEFTVLSFVRDSNLVNSASDKNFVWHQEIASNTWTVPHNLNKYPSINVVDNIGNVLIVDVSYIDNNTIQISHSSIISGYVYCN